MIRLSRSSRRVLFNSSMADCIRSSGVPAIVSVSTANIGSRLGSVISEGAASEFTRYEP